MPTNNALHTAAERGDLSQVQSHVRNFDINAKGENDQTALVKAASKGYTHVVKLLLTKSPDVNLPDVSAFTVISVHLICVSSTPHIFILSYTTRHIMLSLLPVKLHSCTTCSLYNSYSPLPMLSFLPFSRVSLSLGHIHTYIHTYIHVPITQPHIHTHILTYIHTYINTP